MDRKIEGPAAQGEPNQQTATIKETVSEDLRLSIHREATFTTEPRVRIKRGQNITIRRCYEIARFLQQCGFNDGDKLKRADLDNAVDKIPGMDSRTHNRYIGYDIRSRPSFAGGVMVEPPRILRKVKGYLERLRIIEADGNGVFVFHAFVVPSNEVTHGFNANLCVFGFERSTHILGMESEVHHVQERDRLNNNNTTPTNQLGESTLKRVAQEADMILHAVPCVDPDRAKVQWRQQP